MNKKAELYIHKLGLLPHPEGGFFRESYRSAGKINFSSVSSEYRGVRNFCTLIYFLIEGENFSAFHKIKSDEIWHFYDGCAVKIFQINEQKELKKIFLGKDLSKGETLHAVIERNTWFAAELADKNSFALIGCTVSPGFEFEDFELGKRDQLIKQFPEFRQEILNLTWDDRENL